MSRQRADAVRSGVELPETTDLESSLEYGRQAFIHSSLRPPINKHLQGAEHSVGALFSECFESGERKPKGSENSKLLSGADSVLFLSLKRALECAGAWRKLRKALPLQLGEWGGSCVTLCCVYIFCSAWHEHTVTTAVACHFENLIKNTANSFCLHTTKEEHKVHTKHEAGGRAKSLPSTRQMSAELGSRLSGDLPPT